MTQAIWNNTVLAETDNCVVIDGHCYFPPESVRSDYLRPARMRTTCPQKGVASIIECIGDLAKVFSNLCVALLP